MQFLCIVFQPIEMKKLQIQVIDGKQSVVWQQAENRMYVQQSILNYLLNHVEK